MKKTHIIAVLCHKGGVAKTTTTAALAGALVKSHPSKKVLILDATSSRISRQSLE